MRSRPQRPGPPTREEALDLNGTCTTSPGGTTVPADTTSPGGTTVPADTTTAAASFAALGVSSDIVAALAAAGISTPFPIQALALPLALAGHDLMGQARTGTGKTLAFAIPIVQRLRTTGDGRPQALVVVPTRELAIQVARDVAAAGRTRNVRTVTVYGGRGYEPQIEALRAGIDVVVGTPGRLLDLVRQRHLDLSSVTTLILDEADEMLDLGFLPDVERILAELPSHRQSMLFSATLSGPIVGLARRFLRQPTHVHAEGGLGEESTATEQHAFRTHQLDKPELLARVLQVEGRELTLVFCRTKLQAQRVADDLKRRGFAVAAVHGDLAQAARERALRAFRAGKVDVLVATDVAARGIDVPDITHVVNYDCPDDETTYLHRIGRTGRAGRSGVAVTFVDWAELTRWKLINDALGLPFVDPAETYSTSAHLYETLAVPPSTTGVLPQRQRTRAGLAAEKLEDLGETGRARSDRPQRAPARAAAVRPTSRRRTRGGLPIAEVPAAPTGHEAAPEGPEGAALATRSPGDGGSRNGEAAHAGAGATVTELPEATAQAAARGAATSEGPRRRRRGGRGRGGRSGRAAEASGDGSAATSATA